MHIGYITYEFPLSEGINKGGIGTYNFQISKLMNKMGHQVDVFCASLSSCMPYLYENVRINPVTCSNQLEFREAIIPYFRKIHQINPFNIVESAEVNANGILIQKLFPEIPFITRMHTPNAIVTYQQVFSPFYIKLRYVIGCIIFGRLDLGYWRRRAFNKESDIEYQITDRAIAVTVPSEALKNWAIHYWNIPVEKITIIPNPVSFSADLLNLTFNPGKKIILYLGRLELIKGVVNLTISLKKVLRCSPDWKIHFAGINGPSHIPDKTMRNFIFSELKLYSHQLKFTDIYSINELPTIFKDASFCILPSYFESFSYTCAESMLAGKAIIGSNSGGMKDLLDNGNAGILVNPKSVKDITKALIRFIKNMDETITYGKKARERLILNYNDSKIGKEFDTYYKSIISKN